MARINVTKSLLPDRERFEALVARVLDSGWLTNRGEMVRTLESRLAEKLGVEHVVLVGNATLGLQVAFRVFGLRGEVVTTPFTFIATASAIVWEGLEVVFADIEPDTLTIDVEQIRRRITERTSAIVPVHVFGNPCDREAIAQLAAEHDLRVIYDAAHAFGVKVNGKGVASWGDVSVFSFHATKLFHTVEGGALAFNDGAAADRARKLINFGITGPETIECLGINCKMNELQAAMGLCLLDDMDRVIERRGELASIYDHALEGLVARQRWREGAEDNHGYYPVLLRDQATTERVQQALNRSDVFPRRYFYPSLDTLPFLGGGEPMVRSQDVASRVLCLPLYPELQEEQCLWIADLIRGELASAR